MSDTETIKGLETCILKNENRRKKKNSGMSKIESKIKKKQRKMRNTKRMLKRCKLNIKARKVLILDLKNDMKDLNEMGKILHIAGMQADRIDLLLKLKNADIRFTQIKNMPMSKKGKDYKIQLADAELDVGDIHVSLKQNENDTKAYAKKHHMTFGWYCYH